MKQNLIESLPIVSRLLVEKFGFDYKVDYDKDFDYQLYPTLKIVTYRRKVVGELEIHVTDTFTLEEPPETYKFLSTTVEIMQGNEFQEVNISKMWQLLMLINLLQGRDLKNIEV